MYRLFIVEDDPGIANAVAAQAQAWNLQTHIVQDFSNVMHEFAEFSPHIVLLDIMLPFFDGYHWCSEIRRVSKVPIIFVSSASDNMNIVMAMNMGGDDFISKPFDLTVMVAKIQALLRRSYSFSGTLNVIEHQGVILNLNDATVEYQQTKIELTKNEFKILQLLLENKSKIVSREEIMECLWLSDSFIDDNTLTVNVTRLRKRLNDIGLENFIKTKKGIGYMVE